MLARLIRVLCLQLQLYLYLYLYLFIQSALVLPPSAPAISHKLPKYALKSHI